jgi:hypothetical protein
MGVTAGIFLASILLKEMRYLVYTAISIKVVPEQSGKVEYERERLLGIAKRFINLLAIPSKPFALVFDFSALLGDNLN